MLAAVVLVSAWTAVTLVIGDYWMPSPWSTARAVANLLAGDLLPTHLAYTVAGALLGLISGFIPGITLPLVWHNRPTLLTVLEPFVAAGYGLPKLAVAPLLMLWLGLGLSSTVGVVALSTFFLGYMHAAAGVKATDPQLRALVLLLGGSSRHVRWYVVLPGAAPYMLAGLRLAIPYGIGITVIAEMLSSNRGLGFVVQFSAMNFDSAGVFGALSLVTLFAVACDHTLRAVERRLTPWIERAPPKERH